MLIDYSKINKNYIVYGKTDMRKSIDGLTSIIQNQYNMDFFRMVFFCFVVKVEINTKHSIWRVMVLYCFTTVLKMVSSIGPEARKKFEIFSNKNLDGF